MRLTLEGHVRKDGAYPKLRGSLLLESIAAPLQSRSTGATIKISLIFEDKAGGSLPAFSFPKKYEKIFKKHLTKIFGCGIMILPRMGSIFLCAFLCG